MEQEWIDESHGITRYYTHLQRNSGNEAIGREHIRAKFTLEYRKVGWRKGREKERERGKDSAAAGKHLLRSLLNAVFYIRLIPSGFTRGRPGKRQQRWLLAFAKFQIHRVPSENSVDPRRSTVVQGRRSLAWPVNIREYLSLCKGGKSILDVVENVFATRLSFRVHDYATRIGSLNRHNR